jgi:hypothetical protein
MIKKLWVKFDELEIECFCEENRKECAPESKPECELYVVKFIKIKRDNTAEQIKESLTREEKAMKEIIAKVKRYESEFKKSIKKFKV